MFITIVYKFKEFELFENLHLVTIPRKYGKIAYIPFLSSSGCWACWVPNGTSFGFYGKIFYSFFIYLFIFCVFLDPFPYAFSKLLSQNVRGLTFLIVILVCFVIESSIAFTVFSATNINIAPMKLSKDEDSSSKFISYCILKLKSNTLPLVKFSNCSLNICTSLILAISWIIDRIGVTWWLFVKVFGEAAFCFVDCGSY